MENIRQFKKDFESYLTPKSLERINEFEAQYAKSNPNTLNNEIFKTVNALGTTSGIASSTNLDNTTNLNTTTVQPSDSMNVNMNENKVNNEMSVDMVMQPLNINAIKPGGIDSGFKVSNEPNIFDNPTMPFSITEEDVNSTVDDSIVVSQSNSNNKEKIIEINNRRIKLFEELAQTYKEENELLGQNSTNLEKTASNMFDNNGSLNIY